MKANSRQNILIIVLVAIVAVYVISNELNSNRSVKEKPPEVLDIPNEAKVTGVNFESYSTKLLVSYSYNGKFGRHASILISPKFNNPEKIIKSDWMTSSRPIRIGQHKDVFYLQNPCNSLDECEASEINIKIVNSKDYFKYRNSGRGIDKLESLFDKDFQTAIKWKVENRNIAKTKSEVKDLDVAIWYIDSNKRGNLSRAKKILDKIIIETPENIQAYVELARYHMKTSWNTVGLKRAEDILNAAHSKDAQYANTFVLRGYVYTHQKKYSLAEADFVKAEELGTDNLWLQANWGELHERQNNDKKALVYYQKAIDHERLKPSPNDRARKAAFRRAKNILHKQKNMTAVDRLLGEKVNQFSKNSCFLSDWADFKLFELGEYDEARELALKGVSGNCENKNHTNRVYADSLLAEWYIKETSGSDGSSSYIKALALDANWSSRLLRFSTSQTFSPILEKLLKEKVDIDEVDSEGYSALAYAAVRNNSKAVTSLIELGSDPNKKINEDYSAFLLSAIYSSKQTIQAFIDSKVHLKTKFDGGIRGSLNIEDILVERGFEDLLNKLSGNI